ncbi:MAG TPA: chain length determinant protein EpsF [Aquabacterium sp.]|nr:chain length determinant protein EpsF [Aquabacterium sp.]
MTFDQFLRIIRARWKLALGIFLFSVVATVVGSLIFPKKYAAISKVLIDGRPDPISGNSVPANLSNMTMLATQIDIIQSERVARQVVQTLKIGDNEAIRKDWIDDTEERGDYTAWVADVISKGLKVSLSSRESNVIEITYEGTDPAFSAALANAFAQAYIDTSVQVKVAPSRLYNDFFEQRSRVAREKLDAAQQKLAAAQRERGILATDERMDIEMARLADLSSQVIALRALKSEAAVRTTESRRDLDGSIEAMTSPNIAALKADIGRTEAQLQQLLSRYGDRHPNVLELRANIDTAKAQLRREMARISTSLGMSSNMSSTREAVADQAYEAQREKLMKMKESRSELAVLEREVENAQRMYEAIMARMGQTTLESASAQSPVSILSVAVEPTEASSPRLVLNTIIAVVLGALIAMIVALLLELFDRRIRSSDDLTELLETPVLGQLPGLDANKSRKLALPKGLSRSNDQPALT